MPPAPSKISGTRRTWFEDKIPPFDNRKAAVYTVGTTLV